MKTYIKPDIDCLTLHTCLPIAISGVSGTANMDEGIDPNKTTDEYLSRHQRSVWDDDEEEDN